MIINKAKVSNYAGGSLSIQWESGFFEIKNEWTHIDMANDLRTWWNERNKENENTLKRGLSDYKINDPSVSKK